MVLNPYSEMVKSTEELLNLTTKDHFDILQVFYISFKNNWIFYVGKTFITKTVVGNIIHSELKYFELKYILV